LLLRNSARKGAPFNLSRILLSFSITYSSHPLSAGHR
jgi:hypothetical protein